MVGEGTGIEVETRYAVLYEVHGGKIVRMALHSRPPKPRSRGCAVGDVAGERRRRERAYAAFNDGDLGTVLAMFDPDIEWNASDVFFDQPRTHRGRRTWQEEFLRDLLQIFEEYWVEPEELKDAGDQGGRRRTGGGRGRRKGTSDNGASRHVLTFRDGRLVRFTEFKDVVKPRSRRAAGEQATQGENVELSHFGFDLGVGMTSTRFSRAATRTLRWPRSWVRHPRPIAATTASEGGCYRVGAFSDSARGLEARDLGDFVAGRVRPAGRGRRRGAVGADGLVRERVA